MAAHRPKTLLILSQTYVPDPAASGQQLAGCAAEMVRRGWRVRVLTARRGYYDPSVQYPSAEAIDGVDVRRVPLSSFGTRNFALRLLAAVLFCAQILVRGVFVPRVDCILVSTSPPMCFVVALVVGFVRRVPIKFWVMDLTPDLLVALERTSPTSLTARTLDFFNRRMLRRAADVIVLDRFMADRVNAKLDVSDRLTVSPCWPCGDAIEPVAHADNPFRSEHGLEGTRVIMYSGNFGLAVPLETFVEAALRLKDDPRVRFVLIGGGARKSFVTDLIARHRPANMLDLPYQPLARLRYSLSAADVHVVSLGDRMVGITHPSKIYGAMAVGRPILYLGPSPSNVSEIVETHDLGWRIAHGDTDGAERTIRAIIDAPAAELEAKGRRARALAVDEYSREILCPRFCNVIERGIVAAS